MRGDTINILVSACLLGLSCRYDGKAIVSSDIILLKEKYNIIPICPEIFGGLPTPRSPAERMNNTVINATGEDVTEKYKFGAAQSLYLAEMFACRYAILKQKSPSCGSKIIYDGTFSRNLVRGLGITAELLLKNGIKVFDETQIDALLREIC